MAENKKGKGDKTQKKKGYLLLTLMLFLVFAFSLIGGLLFLDIIGFVNLSKVFPPDSTVGKMPYVGQYIQYSYEMHLSEEDRLKMQADRYQEILENKRIELELMDENLKKREAEAAARESELKKREDSTKRIEDELKKRAGELDNLKKNYEGKSSNVDKFALVYAKMNEVAAAKILEKADTGVSAQILEKMNEKQVAKILEALSGLNVDKARAIVEIMTKKKE